MKTIEQIADYLAAQKALNDEQMGWLQRQGFLRPKWESNDHKNDDNGDWCDGKIEERLKPGELEHIEMDLLREADAERVKIPSRGSKAARRSRIIRKKMRNASRQKNNHRRTRELWRQLEKPTLTDEGLIRKLQQALSRKDPEILHAALLVMRKLDYAMIEDSVGITSKLIQLMNHDLDRVAEAAFDLFFKPTGNVVMNQTNNALIDHSLDRMIASELKSATLSARFFSGIFRGIFSINLYCLDNKFSEAQRERAQIVLNRHGGKQLGSLSLFRGFPRLMQRHKSQDWKSRVRTYLSLKQFCPKIGISDDTLIRSFADHAKACALVYKKKGGYFLIEHLDNKQRS